ncbi:MAG: peptidylprolyl isomerase [Woeseiaceae bacterium]|nr:peptidylprolyl isomerase [Woeseiaceae bacterium]
MKTLPGFGLAGAIAIGVSLSTFANAETVLTVNGADIDSSVIELYIESRSQRPAAQVVGAERDSLIEELTDIYLLSTQPRADELASEGRTAAQLELQKRGILAQVVATDFIANNTATDEEILEEYGRQIELAPPKQFKARHILVESQAAAVDLITQLDEGADFIELAKENSTGPSGPNGGDLGWFSPNQMVKPFSDAVAAMEDGAYTPEPVQTQFGWHVILREESRDAEPPTLEGVRDVIKQRIEQQKLQDYLEGLRGQLEGTG